MKGLTLADVGSDVGDVDCDGKKYDDHRERKDEWEAGSRLLRRESFGTAPVFSDGGWRLRGMGGGITGRPSYRCVISASVGMGVIRALRERAHRQLSGRRDSNGRDCTQKLT